MKELIECIGKNLVDNPEGVWVKESVQDDVITYDLFVSPEETGKVIGKHGKIANAIRVIVNAMAARNNIRVILNVPDVLNVKRSE
jgi:predicted RNA-binding protein YlqC (UPF0109 family)